MAESYPWQVDREKAERFIRQIDVLMAETERTLAKRLLQRQRTSLLAKQQKRRELIARIRSVWPELEA
jgi:hypothetical protein